jgi:hypothetical protein
MDNNFVLNVIWKEEKIVKIDDENLSLEKLEKFYYNPEKSKEQKLVFTKKNLKKEIKKKLMYLIYAIGLALFAVVLGYIAESLGINGKFATGISVVIILSIGFMILGAISIAITSPFNSYKNIIFEIDEFGQERIRKQNAFGSISTILNLENIIEIKQINDKKYSYFLVAEQNGASISEKAIIFSIESENRELLIETKKMLNNFIQKEIIVSEITTINI